jgi:YggT family protein
MAQLIKVVSNLFIWIVIASIILSYFMAPYHPVRQALDRIVEPFLAPIRRLMPNTGAIDFSPIVLVLAVELVSRILINLLLSY